MEASLNSRSKEMPARALEAGSTSSSHPNEIESVWASTLPLTESCSFSKLFPTFYSLFSNIYSDTPYLQEGKIEPSISTSLADRMRLVDACSDLDKELHASIVDSFKKGSTQKEIITSTKYNLTTAILSKQACGPLQHIPEAHIKDLLKIYNKKIDQAILFMSDNPEEGSRYLKLNKLILPKEPIYSLISTKDGTFALLNSLSDSEYDQLGKIIGEDNLPYAVKRNALTGRFEFVVGEGSFGIIRFAMKLNGKTNQIDETNEICIVKKLNSQKIEPKDLEHTYHRENKISQTIKATSNLINWKTSAYVEHPQSKKVVKGEKGKKVEKGYIFMDFAGRGDGFSFAEDIRNSRKNLKVAKIQNSIEAFNLEGSIIKNVSMIAFQMLQGLNDLHNLGIYHLDIKPENMIGNLVTGFKLGDFGLSLSKEEINNLKPEDMLSGTPGYLPPELGTTAYTPSGHDSFGLGISLLTMLQSLPPSEPANQFHKDDHILKIYIESKAEYFRLELKKDYQFYRVNMITTGLNFDTRELKGNTLHEIIAQLLDADPTRRITAADALKLPFFQQAFFQPPLFQNDFFEFYAND